MRKQLLSKGIWLGFAHGALLGGLLAWKANQQLTEWVRQQRTA